jgi:transposase
MFGFFQGCPRLVVPDNLKAGVQKPSFYDPEVNRTYARMAAHYEVGILPARPGKPRDKAKVEAGVRFAQSYILGPAPPHLLFAPRMQRRDRDGAEPDERAPDAPPRHQSAPVVRGDRATGSAAVAGNPVRLCRVRLARVGPDYHVAIDSFFYSVPHALIRQQVDVCIAAHTIEVFHRGKRVAAHPRRYGGRRHGTIAELVG